MSANKRSNPGLSLLDGIASGAKVLVEVGRHTSGNSPEWSTPFYDSLYIARYNGIPCGVSLNGKAIAEFDPRHNSEGSVGDVEFHSEDCILRILEINGTKVAESANGQAEIEAELEEFAAIQVAALIGRMRFQ